MMEFKVTGMSCGHCVRAVTEAVQGVDPQAVVEVDLPAGKVSVQSQHPADVLLAAIREEGYEAEPL